MSTCPGCGLVRPDDPAAVPADGLDASAECWAVYGEVTARAISEPRLAPWHQLAVDAYAAQHPLASAKPIRTAFALIGLLLAVERGASGFEVRAAHKRLADARRDWPAFARPAALDEVRLTVAEVRAATDPAAHIAALQTWAAAVWAAWRPAAGDAVAGLLEPLR
ncbi:DUF5946 family protein [Gryllotalpicola ginsengisoli]|uniref:DUF5946 family protein n=1 Tax=Gryllotalpicola ginsengisoli TaxID=444608 RepID=UPI0004054F33|nr:DUF5946 family protein [Gryllotalpicola ginsengisoli]